MRPLGKRTHDLFADSAPDNWCSIGELAAKIVTDLRFQRDVERLHELGPRTLAEFLAELGVKRAITTVIDQQLSRYASLDTGTLSALGGDRFPPSSGGTP